MDVSVRTYAVAGVAFLTAGAIAVAPVSAAPPPVTMTSAVRLVVSPTDVEVAVDRLQAQLSDGTVRFAAAVGLPGQGLIGVVDNITAGFDALFTGLLSATSDPTLVQSFSILRSFAVDAWAMLAHNLTRINAVITGTTEQVGDLLTTALTATLRTMLVAGVNAINAPLSPASYSGLLTAGIETGRLIVGNGLGVVQSMGDAGFDIADVVTDELTFQLNNAVSSLSTLLEQLGDASGSGIAKAVVSAVRGLAFAPALSVVNAGSQAIKTVIGTAQAGFDAVLGVGSSITGRPVGAAVPSTRRPHKLVSTGTAGSAKPRPGKASANARPARGPATGHSPRPPQGGVARAGR